MFKMNKKDITFKNRHSITSIMVLSFLGVLLIQLVVLFFNFILLRTDHKLEQNAYRYIFEKVESRSRELERYLTELWANSEYMKQIMDFSQTVYNEHVNLGKNFVINKDISGSLLDMVELMEISGAFIVFDDKPDMLGIKKAVHLADANLRTKFADKSDIILRVGEEKIAGDLGVYLENDWKPFIDTRTMSKTIYEKAIKIAKTVNPREKTGFWFSPSDVSDTNGRSIYFIQPLFDDSTGIFYGVIGIEVGDELINEILRYTELSESGKGAYILANEKYVSAVNTNYDVISIQGPYVKRLVKDNELFAHKIKNKYYNEAYKIQDNKYLTVLDFENTNKDMTLIAIQRPIRLSAKDSSENIDTNWYLMGVIDKSELEIYSKELIESIIETLLLSLIIDGIIIYLVSYLIGYPLRKLSNDIKESYTKGGLRKIKHMNIVEIDNIIDTIEVLSQRLLSSSKKFQGILDSASIPIIAVEKDEASGVVYKMGELSSIFPGYINNEKFEVRMSAEEYDKASRYFFSDTIIIDSIYDIEKDTQIDIRKKIWNGESYYIKVIIRQVKNYWRTYEDMSDDSNETSDKKTVTLQVIMDYTKDMIEKIKIQKERDFDVLTDLLNRLSFKERVEEYIEKDVRKSKKAAMVMWDLDNLKYVNDTYGHDFGDSYIRCAGSIIGILQGKDSFVARVSGDEFFAFIEYEYDKDEIRQKIENIKIKLDSTNLRVSEDISVRVRATSGIAWYPDDATVYDDLHRLVDFAMYTAKNSQKGSIGEFNRDSYDKNYILISGREDLNKFIDEKQVKFAFQPIVSAKDGEVFAYEALMRSVSDKIKNVGDIMRLAKSQSKLLDIEILTFEGVLRTVSKYTEKFKDKHIFINSIASTSIPEQRFYELLNNYKDDVDFSKMVIEIIESEEVDLDALSIKQRLATEINAQIAIDDFGSGYATESWLLQVNPNFVKIDMALIRDIDKDMERQSIVENILKYTKERKIKVICEGVETHQEMKKLINMGADFIQGFYLAKPDFEIKDISREKKREIQVLNVLKGGQSF